MLEVLKYCKLQICLMLVMLFVSYLFIKDGNRLNRKTKSMYCNHYFDALFILAEFAFLFDAITAYTVNHLDQIPEWFNTAAHLAYLLAYEAFIFSHFLYWLSVTDSFPKKWWTKLICYAPVGIAALVTVVRITDIYYYVGVYTNYAKGIPAYACFAVIGLYSILTLVVFVTKRSYILKNKRTAFIIALTAVSSIMLIQILFNETLVAGIAVIIVILSIYLCLENPSIKFLEFYHSEMVMGFATLVESKDGSTGGHIRRSSAYAVLIAEELRKKPEYRRIITKDYIHNLNKAAPMHDIGKIEIPDDILQKPGKLTVEEYEIMKKHPEIGSRIIQVTFGHLDDEEYEDMTYKLTIGHHEKWNGNGYPHKLSGTDIPLCARIMAVADVFDAVSAKRCYRDAMPLEMCYQIISDGRGEDFDPCIVDVFLSSKRKIERIYYSR